MKAHESEAEFRSLLRSRSLSDRSLTGADALAVMIAFYSERRAEDCDTTPQGDMLLYQWGIYGISQPQTFWFDITRQFIIGAGEDDDIFQLRFTLHYPVSDEIRAIRAGNHWCRAPVEIAAFENFVRNSMAFHYTAARSSKNIEIDYESAG